MFTYRSLFSIVLSVAFLLMLACSSDGEVRTDEDLGDNEGPRMATEEDEDGFIVERLDTAGDGHPDIIRYYEEYQHPRDEDLVRRRIRKMEIDVNGDQEINVRRFYDEFGNVTREENDLNLDGNMTSILYFVGGELARKEMRDESGENVIERRIYFDGKLVRVERDRHGDGEIDVWEYYEDGVLMRIGRDSVGDGSADTWQLR